VYKKKGEYSKALEIYTKAQQIISDIFGSDHIKYSVVTYNLADVLRKLDNFRKAEEMYKESLRIIERVYGSNHPEVAGMFSFPL